MHIIQILHHNLPHLANLLFPRPEEQKKKALFQDILLLQYRGLLLSQLWEQEAPWSLNELLGKFSAPKPWQEAPLWKNEQFSFLTKTIPVSSYTIEELFPCSLASNYPNFISELHQAHERILGENLRLSSEKKWQLQSSLKSERKNTGAFYTPEKLIKIIIDQLLEPVDQRLKALPHREQEKELLSLRFCDPSCGTGNFLIYLQQTLGERLFHIREEKIPLSSCLSDVSRSCIYGTDISWLSIELCRFGLWWNIQTSPLSNNLATGDALLGWINPSSGLNWRQSFPAVFKQGGFDFVVGNPPYVDSETMKKYDPELRRQYQKGFLSTKGNWDLYIPFSELGLRLLKSGGIVALLTPKNILGSDYAKALQKIWLDHQLLWVQDFSHQDWFVDAKVSVVVVACQHTKFSATQNVSFSQYLPTSIKQIHAQTQLLQQLPSGYISFPLNTENPERLAWLSLPRLATIATCSDGASTKEAYEIRALVYQGSPKDKNDLSKIKLINTGTIDPFKKLWGEKECRYLKFRGLYPVINSAHLKQSHPRRWKQAMSAKLIVAGLSSQIEAVLAPPSYLCGKTATQIIPKEALSFCLNALACYLNSSIIFSFYKAIFAMRGFSPRSLLIGPRQIEQLPIPDRKYFTQWSAGEDITAQNQLSYWGQHPSMQDPLSVQVFILDILRSD